MSRGKTKKQQKKRPSKITYAPLLAKFFLITLGSLPVFLFKKLFAIIPATAIMFKKIHHVKKLPKIRLPLKIKTPDIIKPLPNIPIVPALSLPAFSQNLPARLFISQKRGRGRPKKFRLPHLSWKISLFLILAVVFLYTYFIFKEASQLPAPDRLSGTQPLTSEFYDRNGKLLYRLYEDRNRSLVKITDLPKDLVNATIAIEDKNFYKHGGVDPIAIARAAYNNWNNKSDLQGASTITQQLVKNSLLSPEKTYSRKIKEILLAFWVERVYSKNDILQMYFNEVPYGGPAWGVEAAARMYFGKSAKDLDLAQSAYLAGLPASPTEYSPYGTTPQLGFERQKEVLKRMIEEKYITREQAEKAEQEKLEIQPFEANIKAPHFVMYVRDYLAKKYGSRLVSQGGLKVMTTLDLDLQENVQQVVKEEVDKLAPLNVQNGAAMITDAHTGQILAMVGSKDYYQPQYGNYNVTIALRQPGSSIKPITYSTAFKKGYSPGNTILDTPVVFRDQWGNSYAPGNYDNRFHGPVSIRTALGSSYNIPAVKMLATVGVDDMIATAHDLGITSLNDRNRYGLSLTLGAGEVKLIDMMSVYGTFADGGIRRTPNPVLKITDSFGNVVEEYQDNGVPVLQPEIAYMITSILSDNNARTPAFGPSSLLNIPGQYVAVKTGTSDNKKDNWTFGYSNDVVIGVWVGNPDSSPMDQSLTSGVTGAAPIWNRLMRGYLTLHASSPFIRPAGIAEGIVDGRKDLVSSGILPKGLVRTNQDKDKITFYDAFSTYATSSAQLSARENLSN